MKHPNFFNFPFMHQILLFIFMEGGHQLVSSPLRPQHLKPRLRHSRWSMNICRMNERLGPGSRCDLPRPCVCVCVCTCRGQLGWSPQVGSSCSAVTVQSRGLHKAGWLTPGEACVVSNRDDTHKLRRVSWDHLGWRAGEVTAAHSAHGAWGPGCTSVIWGSLADCPGPQFPHPQLE